MATIESSVELRHLLRVEFARSARGPYPLELAHTTAALEILRDLMDSCYAVMNPSYFMVPLFTWRNRGRTDVTRWDERYLEVRERLRPLREPEDTYGRLVKAHLMLQGRWFWPLRIQGPPLPIISIRRGSLIVVLDIAEWAAGGGLVGLLGTLYLAQTHNARVRKTNATLEADAAEAQLRLSKVQRESLTLLANRLDRDLTRMGLEAEFDIDATPLKQADDQPSP